MSDKRITRLGGLALTLLGLLSLNLARHGSFDGYDGGLLAVAAFPIGIIILIYARPKRKKDHELQ